MIKSKIMRAKKSKKISDEQVEKSEIERLRFQCRSSSLNIFRILDNGKKSYIASTSCRQAKIDYEMHKIYKSMPVWKRRKYGVPCNPVPDISGIEAKVVY